MPPLEIIAATIIVVAYFYFVVFGQRRSTPAAPKPGGKIHAKFKGNNNATIDLDGKTMEITNEKNEKRVMDIEEVSVTPSKPGPPPKN